MQNSMLNNVLGANRSDVNELPHIINHILNLSAFKVHLSKHVCLVLALIMAMKEYL